MPESSSLLLRAYGSSPQMKILDYLMDFPKNDFTQKEIIESLGMSKTTFYKYFDNLVDFGMIRVNRKIANAKIYSINTDSPVVQGMRKNIDYISEKIADGSLHKISVQAKHKIMKLNELKCVAFSFSESNFLCTLSLH